METTYQKETSAIIRELKALLSGHKLEMCLLELNDLGRFADSGSFRILLAGGHLVGKNMAANLIIGKELLPVDAVVLENVRITIRAGYEKSCFVFTNDSSSEIPTSTIPWDKIFQAKQPLKEIIIQLQDEWLEQNHLIITCQETLNLPEINADTETVESDWSQRLVASEVVFLVISATTPLSIMEKSILNHMITQGYVPHIAVAISRIGQIQPVQRDSVVNYITGVVRSISENITIVVLPDNKDQTAEVPHNDNKIQSALPAELLENWASQKQRQDLKDKSVRRRLFLLIDRIEAILIARNMDLSRNEEIKNRELLQLRYKIEKKGLIWEDIRLATLKKSNECSKLIRNFVEKSRDMTINRLKYELLHSNNPKQWWENDLPYKINLELDNMFQGMEKTIDLKAMQDINWMRSEVKAIFSQSLQSDIPRVVLDEKSFNIRPPAEDVENINKSRNVMRLVTGGATAAVFILQLIPFGGVNVILGVISNMITDHVMTEKIKQQAESLSDTLGVHISRHYSKILSDASDKVHLLYTNVLEEIKNEESHWHKQQESLLGNHPAYVTSPDLLQITSILNRLEETKALL